MKSIKYFVTDMDGVLVKRKQIVAGVESGMRTILVLTGVTHRADIAGNPYCPTWVLDSVAEIEL